MLWILACAAPADDQKLDSDTAVVDTDRPEGELSLPFSLDASATGDIRLRSVEILDAAGTVGLERVDHVAIAYQDHDWVEEGYHLYDLLSIAEDGSNLAVTYLYCQGTEIPYAFTESFTHAMNWETAHGTCGGSTTPSTVDVALPTLTATPTPIASGITFTSGELAEGVVTLDGVTRDFVNFNKVDCTSCAGGPWYELHTLLTGPDDMCFTIFYLYPEDQATVDVEYSLCLPSLERPTGTVSADWTGSLGGPPPPEGMFRPPPPRR